MTQDANASHMGAFLILTIRAGMAEKNIPARRLAEALDVQESSVSRLLNAKANTPRSGWDELVSAYAEVSGATPTDVWRKALNAWRADPDGKTLAIIAAATLPRRRRPAAARQRPGSARPG